MLQSYFEQGQRKVFMSSPHRKEGLCLNSATADLKATHEYKNSNGARCLQQINIHPGKHLLSNFNAEKTMDRDIQSVLK